MASIVKISYTQYERKKRRNQQLPYASNAVPVEHLFGSDPPTYDKGMLVNETVRAAHPIFNENVYPEDAAINEKAYSQQPILNEKVKEPVIGEQTRSGSASSSSSVYSMDKVDGISKPKEFDEEALDEGIITALPQASTAVAVFPQYLTMDPTTITIREVDLPRFGSSFTVLMPNGDAIFHVDRQRPSYSNRQHIIDAKTNETVLTVRRDIGKVPRSYNFEDQSNTKILDLQGNFFVPTQGARATALFTNAVDHSNTKLFMQGSWRNRHAAIKNVATGEVLATMESGTFNFRNFVESRRTYTVTVSKGVDLAVITAMIVALDARPQASNW